VDALRENHKIGDILNLELAEDFVLPSPEEAVRSLINLRMPEATPFQSHLMQSLGVGEPLQHDARRVGFLSFNSAGEGGFFFGEQGFDKKQRSEEKSSWKFRDRNSSFYSY